MKRRKSYLLWGLLLVLLAACSKDEVPAPFETEGRTVLVYIVADNNLSNWAPADLDEMQEGMESVSGAANLLVYLDDKQTPVLYRLVKKKNGKVVREVVKTYPEQVSTDAEVMYEVMNEAFSAYPAEKYGLVYWSHAEGWIPNPLPSTRWIGQDMGNYPAGYMNIADFVSVLARMPHLDFILFDACFMQSVEVAYELRHYTDYLITSPTEIPGSGAPYQKVVPAMFTSVRWAENVAEAYMKTYRDNFDSTLPIGSATIKNPQGEWIAGASIAVLKSSALENLATATNRVLREPVEGATLRRVAFNYDKRLSGFGYYDLVDMIRYLADDEAFIAWKAAFDAAEVYWSTTPANYSSEAKLFSMKGTHGVSHFIPANRTAVNSAYRSTAWYKAAGLAKLGW